MKNRIDRCDVRHDGESHKSAVQITKARSASLPGRGVASLDYKLQYCIRSSKCMFTTTKHFELAAGEGMPNASEKALRNQNFSKLIKIKLNFLAMSCRLWRYQSHVAQLTSPIPGFPRDHVAPLLHNNSKHKRVSKGILAQLIPACAEGVECADFCQARSNHKISDITSADLSAMHGFHQNAQTEECLRMENAGETQGDVVLVRDLSRNRSPCAQC